MPFFPTLGDGATVPDILKMSPLAGKALMEMHESIMRASSPLSPANRELIATYVSGLNQCNYCQGVHAETAKALGVAPATVDALIDDLDGSGVDDALKPILRLARKLTEAPASLTQRDAEAVYEAGWDEQALHDAIMVVCCFNFMNRMLEGHGVHGHEAMYRQRGPMLAEHGYLPLIRLFDQAGGA